MTELTIRVETLDEFFDRTRRSVRQIDAGDVTPKTPSVSFTSVEQFFSELTVGRWAVLNRLRALGPTSIRALAKALGRDYRGVHSDVTRLLQVGLIEKNEAGKILVPWSKITAEVSLDNAA